MSPSNRIKLSPLHLNGFFEFQDLGSQKVTKKLPVNKGMSILDFCAGAGGKSLALASRFKNKLNLYAYDYKASRLKSFKDRADRALAKIIFRNKGNVFNTAYELILVDVPCSGSGTWKRDPMAKWNLCQIKLQQILKSQLAILNTVSCHVQKGGYLCYITCSILRCENQEIIKKFISNNKNYEFSNEYVISPAEGGDGFYVAVLKKVE